MENEKENNSKCKECCYCRYYSPYYTKGLKQFNKTKIGWCGIKLTETYLHDNCEMFDKRIKRPYIKQTIYIVLSQILSEITEIHNVIKEEINNEKEM